MSDFDQRFPKGWRVWSDSTPTPSRATTDPNSREMRELDLITGNAPAKTRQLPLKSLVPLLIDAHQCDSAWLNDFADDTVVIDADLHDVLLAFQNICSDVKRQSAKHKIAAESLMRHCDRDAA